MREEKKSKKIMIETKLVLSRNWNAGRELTNFDEAWNIYVNATYLGYVESMKF